MYTDHLLCIAGSPAIRESREFLGSLISVVEIKETSGNLTKVWKTSGNFVVFSLSKVKFYFLLHSTEHNSID